MKLRNEKQIFNLMDTNGRRKDVINALQGYLSILESLKGDWSSIPKSLAQYLFYKYAIELSPEVFAQHDGYDALQSKINEKTAFKKALENNDLLWIQKNQDNYKNLIKNIDKEIESRARHYTSTLVKLGFATKKRTISDVGNLLLNKIKLDKDELEKFLPLDNVNIIYLRQLLKLRIYDAQEQKYYSPFLFAVYVLLKKERISEDEFFELVQGVNSYFDFSDLDNFLNTYQIGNIIEKIKINIPAEISDSMLSETIFKNNFKNQKSSKSVDTYFRFYTLLYAFKESKDSEKLNELLEFYKKEENRSKINKAFGCGKDIFVIRNEERLTSVQFLKDNKKIFEPNLNQYLYIQYELSKRIDQIKEYSDTTKRIFKATGIISFDNGYVELAYKELCQCIFQETSIRAYIQGESNDYNKYENNQNNYFCSITSLSEIFSYSSDDLLNIRKKIKEKFNITDLDQIAQKIAASRKKEFVEFINKKYPLEKIKELLEQFSDRSKDSEIKKYVSTDATVPTIYEYVVGIAWYYFTGKRIDLLSSYKLTLSADFEPLMHAGGGQGDLVIDENDKVVMLEVTLMNSNCQKRGEWEPVLRHSVNLKVEEEKNDLPRQVTTFFIADEFDANTINIWKAVAEVPLQSSVDRGKYTDNVVIMPITSNELLTLIDKFEHYDEIINTVHTFFKVEKDSFNLNWRKECIDEISLIMSNK